MGVCIRHPLWGPSRVTDREGVLARGPEGPAAVVRMSPSQSPERGGPSPTRTRPPPDSGIGDHPTALGSRAI